MFNVQFHQSIYVFLAKQFLKATGCMLEHLVEEIIGCLFGIQSLVFHIFLLYITAFLEFLLPVHHTVPGILSVLLNFFSNSIRMIA